MGTTTTNYSLNKPTVGGDDDAWGGLNNTSMDLIDTQMKVNADAAATAQAAADASVQDSDIGVTVQAYDADTAKTDVAQTYTADQSHGDNVKAIFGAGSDLQIYHSGTQSYITENGTGDLNIQGNNLVLEDPSGNNYLFATAGGAVSLFHNASTKLATTSTGIDVTGTVTADGLTVDGNPTYYRADNSSQYVAQTFYPAGTLSDSNVGFGTGQKSGENKYTVYTWDGAAGKDRLKVDNNGDVSLFEDTGTTAKFFWDASAESLGVGTSSPSSKLHIEDSNNPTIKVRNTTAIVNGYTELQFDSANTFSGSSKSYIRSISNNAGNSSTSLAFATNSDGGGAPAERLRIDSSGNVGIGVVPETWWSGYQALDIGNAAVTGRTGTNVGYFSANAYDDGAWKYKTTDEASLIEHINGTIVHKVAPSGTADTAISWTTAMTIDNSGNLLVGKTSDNFGVAGHQLWSTGVAYHTRGGSHALALNRLSSDGDIVKFYKNGTTVGSIGNYTSFLTIGNGDCGLLFSGGTDNIHPWNTSSNSSKDNAVDLGHPAHRFDDIYATNGTIQTSDRNEKQDIQAITAAESNVATACKGLLRSFKWQDAVAEKGDDARIHFGIIAQDLQAAFEAEGLDAGDYAMFISSTWWEAERTVDAVPAQEAVYETVVTTPAQEAGFREVTPAVQAEPAYYDIDGNVIKPAVEAANAVHEPTEAVAEVTEQRLVSEAVEAVDACTVTDHFDTLEEAPTGATERTRMGVRYPELLAFIIAAM